MERVVKQTDICQISQMLVIRDRRLAGILGSFSSHLSSG